MKRYLKFILFLIFAIYTAALANMSALAADSSEPQKIIEDSSNIFKARIQDPEFSQDFRKINEFVRSVFYPHVNFDLVSSLVLGNNWKEASPADKENFKNEFQTLLIRVYARELAAFKEWDFKFLPMNSEKDERKALIKTQVLQPSQQPVDVNYRMLKTNDEWKIYDIITDGVSLVETYRTSFKNEIEHAGSLQQVIAELEQRNTEALTNNKPNIDDEENCFAC